MMSVPARAVSPDFEDSHDFEDSSFDYSGSQQTHWSEDRTNSDVFMLDRKKSSLRGQRPRAAPDVSSRKKNKVGEMERQNDVMQMCCKVSSEDKIRAAVKNSKKGAVLAGGGAFLGGLLFGPVGIAIGGTAGSVLGWRMTRGRFKPVPQFLLSLTLQQQKQLYDEVMAALGSLYWTDGSQLIAMVMGNPSMQECVRDVITTYVTKKLHAEIRYGD